MPKKYVKSGKDGYYVSVAGVRHGLVPGEEAGEFSVTINKRDYPVMDGTRISFDFRDFRTLFRRVPVRYINFDGI